MEERAAHSPGLQEAEIPKLAVASLRLHLTARDRETARFSLPPGVSHSERPGAGPLLRRSSPPAGGLPRPGRRGGAPEARQAARPLRQPNTCRSLASRVRADTRRARLGRRLVLGEAACPVRRPSQGESLPGRERGGGSRGEQAHAEARIEPGAAAASPSPAGAGAPLAR